MYGNVAVDLGIDISSYGSKFSSRDELQSCCGAGSFQYTKEFLRSHPFINEGSPKQLSMLEDIVPQHLLHPLHKS